MFRIFLICPPPLRIRPLLSCLPIFHCQGCVSFPHVCASSQLPTFPNHRSAAHKGERLKPAEQDPFFLLPEASEDGLGAHHWLRSEAWLLLSFWFFQPRSCFHSQWKPSCHKKQPALPLASLFHLSCCQQIVLSQIRNFILKSPFSFL